MKTDFDMWEEEARPPWNGIIFSCPCCFGAYVCRDGCPSESPLTGLELGNIYNPGGDAGKVGNGDQEN